MILTPPVESSDGLIMPFYGEVLEKTLCGQVLVGSRTHKELIIAGVSYPFGSCANIPCPIISCSCAGIWELSGWHIALEGGEINTFFRKCIEGEWVELQHYFQEILPANVEILPEDADKSYNIFARINENDPWTYVGIMILRPTTPPECDNVSLCQQPFEPPELNIYQIPDADACNEPKNDIPSGVFRKHSWELRDGEELTLTACQDPGNGSVRFIFNGTNLSEQIYVPYKISLCPDDVAQYQLTRIDNIDQFEEHIDNPMFVLQDYCNLRRAVLRHNGINAQGIQTGGFIPIQDQVWLTEVTEAHEQEHRADYEKYLYREYPRFLWYQMTYWITCEQYNLDPGGAISTAVGNFRAELYTRFNTKASDNYDNSVDEIELNGRGPIVDEVQRYLDILTNYVFRNFNNVDFLTYFYDNACN